MLVATQQSTTLHNVYNDSRVQLKENEKTKTYMHNSRESNGNSSYYAKDVEYTVNAILKHYILKLSAISR